MASHVPPYISEERDSTGIPVTCSKCNGIFESDTDYVVHFKEAHTEATIGRD